MFQEQVIQTSPYLFPAAETGLEGFLSRQKELLHLLLSSIKRPGC